MEVFNSLATVIGLIYNFKSDRKSASDDEYKEFLNWLSDKRHKKLIDELNTNQLLGLSIKGLLQRNHDLVLSKLNHLDESLLQLASGIEGFHDIARAINPNAELSQQAITILRNLVESQGSFILESTTYSGTTYRVYDGDRRSLGITESRFVDDDFNLLCSLGLLMPDFNSSGSRMFRVTRSAVKYIAQVDGQL
ncbi:hypothetical protein MZJ28_001414 [Vibrio parahaemolyticus]|uniref:hypothetical protein n=1 Tax=Vibrio parahaemolyticus TaxID=670 RepID=UPI000B76C8BF|nr:hypothetical protein [Vibrio parahaemolyticus]EGQ8136975.1 hypothetical protein [Vibrio parahaemolyticus]EGQ8148791.1 hypothetical protein [Vibrio parahaemolyticus]EGQ8250636.1 hypothetical protein [Vibrio parahaemolyticus]EGQ8265117.1 hypothetical protein [Vibrio parahaemolyticus]EGQ8270697.1 hypothetical protein [Vibrio parahaemolyticus]